MNHPADTPTLEPASNRIHLTPSSSSRYADRLPRTISGKTRRVYDRLANVYPLSTYLFHSKAHRCALEDSGLRDGMRVLEVATGSGEMFRRLVRANPSGSTLGLDLSPKMAARTQRRIRKEFPHARTLCQAVDARQMPFRDETFDAVICCYLLELLGAEDLHPTVSEFRRVLRAGGRLTMVLIGQNHRLFNCAYRFCGGALPAFWGRQVEQRVPEIFRDAGLFIIGDRRVQQSCYPSRIVSASR